MEYSSEASGKLQHSARLQIEQLPCVKLNKRLSLSFGIFHKKWRIGMSQEAEGRVNAFALIFASLYTNCKFER